VLGEDGRAVVEIVPCLWRKLGQKKCHGSPVSAEGLHNVVSMPVHVADLLTDVAY
jgi:hypothetical protein